MNATAVRQVKVIKPTIGLEANKVQRIAAYCRVSTDSEDQANSFLAQIKYYNDYISSQDNMPTHVPVSAYGLDLDSVVLLEQIRTIDKKRIKGGKIGHLNKKQMLEIDKAIGKSLDMEVVCYD